MDRVTLSYIITEYIKQNKVLFVVFCLTVLALPINEVVLPHFYGKIITGLQSQGNITNYFVIVVAILILVQGLTVVSDMLDIKLYSKMHKFTTTLSLDYLIAQKSVHLSDIEIGKYLARLVRFPSLVYNFIDDWRAFLVPYFLIYLFVVVYLTFYDIVLGTIILILTGIVVFLTFVAMRSCAHVSKKRDAIHNTIFEEVEEILRNIVTVLTNNNYVFEKERLATLETEYSKVSESTLWCPYKFKISFLAIQIIAMVAFIGRAASLYFAKRISTENCISIFIIMLYLNNTLLKNTQLFKDIMTRYGTIQEALLLFENEIIADKPNKQHADIDIPPAYCLVIDALSYSHGNKQVLNNFSMAVKCRENVAIIGEIGSGKSTILKLILKYHPLKQGEIFLYGTPYRRLTREQVRENIGYISQNPILFNRSLYENITYGNRNVSHNDVLAMIERLQLNEHFSRFENGLDAMAGKNGSKLSGGERQIIWILRVLLQNPDIILLDEPTSALDQKTRDTVFKILIDIMKEKTVIAVTHDKELLKHFDKVIEMKMMV